MRRMILSLVEVAMRLQFLFLLPSLAVAQSPIVTERVSVAAANAEWTPTTIEMAAGDIVLVLATGRVHVRPSMEDAGPNGASGLGALYLRIGVGTGQRVGNKAFLIADQPGQVKLRVYDTRYSDNTGAFEATVIHIPASAVPQPRAGGHVVAYALVRNDLRNLVTAEEAVFADSIRYSTSLSPLFFHPSDGVSVHIEFATEKGWAASATHSQWPGWTCGIWIGIPRLFQPGQGEGVPVCWQQ